MLKTKNRRGLFSSLLAILVMGQLFGGVHPASALGPPDFTSTVMNSLINESKTQLSPGISEHRFTYKDSSGSRVESFAVDIDTKNTSTAIMAGTPNDSSDYGMQTVRDQANEAIKNGKQVIAAVNADFYNMATGEPEGNVIKDGVEIHHSTGENFFGIMKDGTPVIGDNNKYEAIKGDLKQALGARNIIVKDGTIGDVSAIGATKEPRTAVGIKADNTVFFVVIDGRQEPYSAGISMPDLAQLMLDMGAVQAVDLDGGGSSTYLSRTPGDEGLSLKNSPSDGNERSVANSWLVVSNTASNHKFASAYITPFDKTYTPNSTINFRAKGTDNSGAPASLPDSGLTWSLSDPSYGQMDSNTGVFQSNGKLGQFQVQLNYNGKTIGSTYVEIAVPDQMYFTRNELSLDLGATENLGLVTRFQGRDVIVHKEDIVWDYDPSLGTIDDTNTIHASNSSASGPVTATFNGTDLSATINLKVGQLPLVLYNFEKGLDDWTTTNVGRGEKGDLTLSTYPDDLVRFGNQSLKINYDFTGAKTGTTLGLYAGPEEIHDIPGSPTGIGMWIYATPEAQGYWLRMLISDANGNLSLNITPESGIDWTGWKYCEAEIPSTSKGPYTTYPKQMIRIMSTKSGLVGGGPMTKGSLYVDNIRAVYGTNLDDLYPPIINSINVDGKTYTKSAVNISASIHDDMTDPNASGINWDTVKIYVDGKDYSDDNGHFSYDKDGTVSLRGLEWSEGRHEVKVDIKDNFGNETIKVGHFSVNTAGDATLSSIMVNGKEIPDFSSNQTEYTVTLPAGEDIPDIKATPSQKDASVEVTQASDLPGTSTIVVTAPDGATTKTYKINFKVDQLDKVTISSSKIAVDRNESAQTSLSVKLQSGADANLSKATIQYTSSDPSIASIDDEGIVTAHKKGSVEITANVTLGGKTVQSNSLKINVSTNMINTVNLGIKIDQLSLKTGDDVKVQLNAMGAKDLNGFEGTFTYDPNLFQLVSVNVNNNFSPDTSKANLKYEDINGKLNITAHLTGDPKGVSGHVDLIDIVLKAKDRVGKTSFTIENGVKLTNSTNNMFITTKEITKDLIADPHN